MIRLTRLAAYGLATGLVTGCGISEEAFPERAADAVCDRIDECTDELETDGEREDCEQLWSGLAELWVDLGDLGGAEYSPSAGADCIREIRQATCAAFNSADYTCEPFE